MALKPRKQRKYYPYLFLLNEKTFLQYLRGQYLEFDYCNITNHPYGDWQLGFYQLSKTKEKIFEGGYLFKRIDFLVNKLTDDEKLDYAPIYCSTWIVTGDAEPISMMLKAQDAYLKKSDKCKSSKDKREERKALREKIYWMGFESCGMDEDTQQESLSNRDYKWWKKGRSDGKKYYEQIEHFSLSYDLSKSTEVDYDKAEIVITPYILNGICWELIDKTESITLTKDSFKSFFTSLNNSHDALSVVVDSGELQSNCARIDGTPYLSSMITYQEFTETIKPLLNPNIEDKINNWKQLGCQYINIDFLQKHI